jgi:adenine phosphoribosyltransferase
VQNTKQKMDNGRFDNLADKVEDFVGLFSGDFTKIADDISGSVKNMLEKVFSHPDYNEKVGNIIRSKIRTVKDFPKDGVDFLDISSLIADPEMFAVACASMIREINMSKVDYIVGVESRGFLFSTMIAEMYEKGLVLVRKRGKLPPPVISINYSTEYSNDIIEMHPGMGSVLVVDDVLATGGTLRAAVRLCNAAGYQVEAASVFIDMIHLHPENIVDVPLFSGLQMKE